MKRAKRNGTGPPLDPAEHLEKLLAEDLHDSVCQSLAGTSLVVNVLRRLAEAGQPVGSGDLHKVAGNLDRAVDDLRALISPDALAAIGLVPALRRFAREMSQNVPCRVVAAAGTRIENPRTALVLYRLARWAVRHALKSAESVRVELARAGAAVTLKVHDARNPVFADLPDEVLAFLRHYAHTAGIAVSLDPLRRALQVRLPAGKNRR